MRTKGNLVLATLVLGLALLAGPSADATTVGTLIVDCTGVRFQGFLAKTDMGRLEQRLHSGLDAGSPIIQDDYHILDRPRDGYNFDFWYPWAAIPDGWYRAAISATNDDVNWFTIAVEEGVLFCLPPAEDEGCSPGYWKNHLEDWAATGFSPLDDFDTIFDLDLFSPDITLEDAVNLKGGGVKKLGRHGAAALLSAAHLEVDYPFSIAGVIAAVGAGEAEALVEANELGCLIP